MSDHTAPVPGLPPQAGSREAVVRFAHVDAAGIVFYPRYLEMLAAGFPELVPPDGPFELEIEFRKPTPLGTRLALELEATEAHGWRLAGRSGPDEQFTMRCRRLCGPALAPDEHEPERAAFRSDPLLLAAWTVGPDARLHLSRYYELVNAGVEQWFERDLGTPFRKLHANRAGIPTVVLETRCQALPRLGETPRIWIRPSRIGSRSVRFESWLVGEAGCLVKTSQVVVFIQIEPEGFRSVAIPEDLRAALQRQLVNAGDG